MIYFAVAQDKLKIGFSNNPSSRVSALQTSNPYDLEIVLLIDGSRIEELKLQHHFSIMAKRGEWFQYGPELKEYVQKNQYRNRTYEFGLEYKNFTQKQQLKRLRRQDNITAKELAAKLNVTQQAVSRMELAEIEGRIKLHTMQKVADVLGYEFQYRFKKRETE